MPIYKAALVRIGQKEDGIRDVVRRGKTSHGVYIDNVLVGVTTACLVGYIHFGFDPARTNGIAAHTESSPLRSKRARQPDQTMLGCVVGSSVSDARNPGNRGYVYDAASALLQHHLPESASQQKGSHQVDLEHPAEGARIDRLRRRNGADTGVVDQHIHPVPARTDCFGRSFYH